MINTRNASKCKTDFGDENLSCFWIRHNSVVLHEKSSQWKRFLSEHQLKAFVGTPCTMVLFGLWIDISPPQVQIGSPLVELSESETGETRSRESVVRFLHVEVLLVSGFYSTFQNVSRSQSCSRLRWGQWTQSRCQICFRMHCRTCPSTFPIQAVAR